jgi:uroporphyrinogen decarboxylase
MSLDDEMALLDRLGDDFRYIWPDYRGPEPQILPDGSFEIPWPWRWQAGERYRWAEVQGGRYATEAFKPWERVTDPEELADFPFPAVTWLDFSTIKDKCAQWPDHVRVAGYGNVINFIAGIGHSLGDARTLMGFATADPVLLTLMDIKFGFHYAEIERVLQEADGQIDIVEIGEDLGTQRGPLISLRSFDRYIAPYFDRFFHMVHHYGAKVMMHSCGSVRMFIPRLIELGLDILEVVQVSAHDMDIRELQKEFGSRISFCGSMDVQTILVSGAVEDIVREVRLRQKLFKDGGLILGPSHLIQPGTPLENILAMYRSVGSLVDQGEFEGALE